MKKSLLALSLALLATAASAENFVSLDVDHVKDNANGAVSQAQYFRAGKDVGQFNLGLQVRTGVYEKGGMFNSVEGTVGRNLGPVNVFGGVGHDNGYNGAKGGSYQYGLLGASAGVPLGPVFAFGGAKTRVNWETNAPKQTVAFAGLSYPLTKGLSLEGSVSRSYQDIQEDAFGLGLRLGF